MKGAFTKSDWAVAALCLLILLALALPAMQSARSRDRSLCENRLGQVAAALMNYEMAHRSYPGYVNAIAPDEIGFVKVGSWAVSLLPFLEHEPLYDMWADPSTTEVWNRRGGGASKMNAPFYPSIRLFMCARDSNPGDMQAPCSFAANCGFFPDILPANYQGLNAHEIARQSSRPANGVFSNQLPAEITSVYTKGQPGRVLGSRLDVPTTVADIRDGLTQTIAFSESIHADSWSQTGPDSGWRTVDIDGVTYFGDDLDQAWSPRVRVGVVWQYKAQPAVPGIANYQQPAQPDIGHKRVFSPELARPSSHHYEVSSVAMLGGSVMTIRDNIDYRVLQSLLTPHTKASDVPEPGYVLSDADF